MLSSVLGSCCLLLALVDRSTAFVTNGSAGVASPRALISRRGGAISSLGSRKVPAAAAALPLVPGAGQQRRRRVQPLGMAIDTTNNPITSKVYGRADTKNTKTPEMNEEIAASGVGFLLDASYGFVLFCSTLGFMFVVHTYIHT